MAEGERLGASFSIDTTQLKAGLAQANRLIRESESQFKLAAAGMDDWSSSEDGLKAKIKSLNEITELQKKKVNALKTQYQNLIDGGLDPASRQAVELRTKINQEEAALKKNENELKNQKKALKDVGKESENAGKSFEKLGEAAKTAGKVAAVAFTAAAAAVGALVKGALDSYAEYEQLVGGVDTLFKDSSKTVQEYANNAYKTAGMSANEYMEKASEYADRAITDMSDNANKMGTSIESIQNAYGGFAKGNFTMLDNLKLGYGGTKEEMQRLLTDATKLSGVEYDLNSYADVVDAIHVVQTELGITGTTAKEASTTIQGSIASMQGAWANLLTGLADENADIDGLIDNLITSVTTVIGNVLPRIKVII
ncbi:MAG: PblA, partial [Clostridia bacterium]|nr:PblA [Clostridia bacterium]